MRRTPQPNLTQSKLTSMLQPSSQTPPSNGVLEVQPDPKPGGTESMAPTVGPAVMGSSGEPLTADFFRKLIGDNTATITTKLDKVTVDVAALTRTVEASKTELAAASAKIQEHSLGIAAQKAQLDGLEERISQLESRGAASPEGLRTHDVDYLRARRSIRMWPIENTSQQTLWKGVGEFLHTKLCVPEAEVGPDDIEAIVAIPNSKHTQGNLNKEALVTSFCQRKRDTVVSHAPNLAKLMDKGAPTAGIRLEIPESLMGHFRLLSRFGTRIRARHGLGTKRHIKFDDVDGTLFMNIKLPGDETWSKVSVETAKIDLEKTAKEESATILRRIREKQNPGDHPGPRERLAIPLPGQSREVSVAAAALIGPRSTQDARIPGAAGQRPHTAWAPRDSNT